MGIEAKRTRITAIKDSQNRLNLASLTMLFRFIRRKRRITDAYPREGQIYLPVFLSVLAGMVLF